MTNGLIQHITVEESTSIQWINSGIISFKQLALIWIHLGIILTLMRFYDTDFMLSSLSLSLNCILTALLSYCYNVQ